MPSKAERTQPKGDESMWAPLIRALSFLQEALGPKSARVRPVLRVALDSPYVVVDNGTFWDPVSSQLRISSHQIVQACMTSQHCVRHEVMNAHSNAKGLCSLVLGQSNTRARARFELTNEHETRIITYFAIVTATLQRQIDTCVVLLATRPMTGSGGYTRIASYSTASV